MRRIFDFRPAIADVFVLDSLSLAAASFPAALEWVQVHRSQEFLLSVHAQELDVDVHNAGHLVGGEESLDFREFLFRLSLETLNFFLK